jgi:hypothetical protein
MSIKVSKWLLENNPRAVKVYIEQGDSHRLGDRAFGKTTGVAFSLIGEAMMNPNTRVNIVETGKLTTDIFLMDTVKSLINANNLKYFSINHMDMTILYKPWTEVEIDIVIKEKV